MIAPARTGMERRRRTAVMMTAQMNSGMRSSWRPFQRIFKIEVMKLREPRMEETPAKWREKIARSTEGPAWATLLASGG